MVRRVRFLLVVSVLVTVVLAINGTVAAQSRTGTIGPHQHFVGLVNGHSTKATIVMVCTSPLSSAEMGHPLRGQTITVEPASTVAGTSGYTGTSGLSVVATFVQATASAASASTVTFSEYGAQTIPSTLLFPCSGSGTVVFSPQPTSKTASSTRVTVTYGNITVGPPTAASAKLTPSHTITVTQADNGHSYRLHKGEDLDVQLSGPSNSVIWTEPASSNQAVLQRTEGSSGATATGTFKAIAKGEVQVTATGTFTCSPPCPGPIMLFEVTVSVVR